MAQDFYVGELGRCLVKVFIDGHARLHVLDCSQGRNYQTVTNGIDNILVQVGQNINLGQLREIILYGTDSLVTRYNPNNRSFTRVNSHEPSVLYEYYMQMTNMYG